MDTKQFLSTVLSENGYYCVAGLKDGKMVRKSFETLDAIVDVANNFDVEERDAYFAPASFVDGASTKGENIHQIKSLFLDLDCGTGKPYPTQTEALAALRDFYKAHKLPRPLIVNSGRGLHVYWRLDKPYPREEWLPVASALKAACLQNGLDIDPAVTSDAARLLRIPNTRNFKNGNPMPVRVMLESDTVTSLEDFAAKLPTDLIPIGAWITKLKPEGPPIKVKSQFGWTENGKSFVVGDKEIFANRIEHNPAGSRTAQYVSMFDKKGTLEQWKDLAKFYNKPGFEQHQYMFGLSFGSPLMEFMSGISGCIYNLNSPETGIGKTTGMWGGASVWGNHKKIVLIGKDTPNSAWNRAEVLKNLPLYIDEVSNYKPEAASDFCYAISDGVQKNRMSNRGENAERYRGEPWSLNCGTTGNNSIRDIAGQYRSSPKGEAGRVTDYTATKLLHGAKDTLEANDLNDQLAENYGHAGPLFIQHVIRNRASVKQLVLDTRTDLVKALNAEPQERFWIAQGATVYSGCVVAKEIGLIDWDLDKLWKWIIKMIKAQRANLVGMDMDIEDIISQFYMDHARSILRITSTANASDPELQNIIPISLQDMPNYRFVARHETDTHRLFIRIPPFKKWLADRKYTFESVKALIFEKMEGKYGKKRMGTGTKMDIGVTHVLACTLNVDPTVQAEDSDEAEA
jgi:hypothetical protein